MFFRVSVATAAHKNRLIPIFGCGCRIQHSKKHCLCKQPLPRRDLKPPTYVNIEERDSAENTFQSCDGSADLIELNETKVTGAEKSKKTAATRIDEAIYSEIQDPEAIHVLEEVTVEADHSTQHSSPRPQSSPQPQLSPQWTPVRGTSQPQAPRPVVPSPQWTPVRATSQLQAPRPVVSSPQWTPVRATSQLQAPRPVVAQPGGSVLRGHLPTVKSPQTDGRQVVVEKIHQFWSVPPKVRFSEVADLNLVGKPEEDSSEEREESIL
jgi:hypothetical protein